MNTFFLNLACCSAVETSSSDPCEYDTVCNPAQRLQQFPCSYTTSICPQISSMMAALKVLLLPATWKAHAFSSKLITGSELKQDDDCGLAWKPAWNLVRKVLDCEWRTFITMLNRHHAWDMKWSVLGVLQLLPPDIECQSQGVILRLRVCCRTSHH